MIEPTGIELPEVVPILIPIRRRHGEPEDAHLVLVLAGKHSDLGVKAEKLVAVGVVEVVEIDFGARAWRRRAR